jgi:hypothetical protein
MPAENDSIQKCTWHNIKVIDIIIGKHCYLLIFKLIEIDLVFDDYAI